MPKKALQGGFCWHLTRFNNTPVNISHLVTSLPTSRRQDVFALLVASCQQVWNNLLTTCNTTLSKLSDLLQGCSGKSVTCLIFNKYKTFSVLIYSYINTSGIGKTRNCMETRRPKGGVFSYNFEFSQLPRVLI